MYYYIRATKIKTEEFIDFIFLSLVMYFDSTQVFFPVCPGLYNIYGISWEQGEKIRFAESVWSTKEKKENGKSSFDRLIGAR